jgi:peptide chain release factor 3
VCRRRGIPIFTFINKLDRPAQDPFALLEEVERVLGITAVPLTWPIGDGPGFKGVYERATRQVHLFERTTRNARPAPVRTSGADDPLLSEVLGAQAHAKLREDIEVIDGLIEPFDHERFMQGELTPVFFGSVLTNFGVQEFLDSFVQLGPAPACLETTKGPVEPTTEVFTAFIFKLQANMNKHHRDRTAYARVASGRFERGMNALHTRTNKPLKLARAHTLFAQERQTVDEAYPGDIIGLINPGVFQIGDMVSSEPGVEIKDFPRFAPEVFATVRPRLADKRKAFRKGLTQLAEEGVVQVFYPTQGARDPMLGAVGHLQFEVFQHRMLEEYNVEILIDPQPYTLIRWFEGDPALLDRFAHLVEDEKEGFAALFRSQWELDYFQKQHPNVKLEPLPINLAVPRA